MFVSAGAGPGKTKVLVERFARAVCDEGVDIESILVITYTEKAAGELRSRIRAAPDRARTSRSGARARRRVDLDDPRLLSSAAALPSVRGRRRPALSRARREPGTRSARRSVRRGPETFCADDDPAAPAAGCVRSRRTAADAHGRLRDAQVGRARACPRARRAAEPRRPDNEFRERLVASRRTEGPVRHSASRRVRRSPTSSPMRPRTASSTSAI